MSGLFLILNLSTTINYPLILWFWVSLLGVPAPLTALPSGFPLYLCSSSLRYGSQRMPLQSLTQRGELKRLMMLSPETMPSGSEFLNEFDWTFSSIFTENGMLTSWMVPSDNTRPTLGRVSTIVSWGNAMCDINNNNETHIVFINLFILLKIKVS